MGSPIDLHSHSTCSDGRLSPAELVAAAHAAGVTTLALTDHDSTAGLAAARVAGEGVAMRLINGVEISVSWADRTLHVVGLGIDPNAEPLRLGLARLQAERRRRAERISARLARAGAGDTLREAKQLAGDGQIGRNHFARVLVARGLCRTTAQAFKRYLRPGKPGHAAADWAALDEAIDWIRSASGIAVLAHPLGYGLTGAWRRKTVAAFAAVGGQAIEICTGTTRACQIQTVAADATAHHLLGSVGSDFHGLHQHWLGLGRLSALPAGIIPVWHHPRLAG